jgi:tRNA-binding protein
MIMQELSWAEFEKVDLRAGTIIDVQDFEKAKKPAFKLWIDFGEELGVKKSSAQITKLYTKDELIGKQVMCVVNFPPRQIADFMSEVLTTGLIGSDGEVTLAVPDKIVPNGLKLA